MFGKNSIMVDEREARREGFYQIEKSWGYPALVIGLSALGFAVALII